MNFVLSQLKKTFFMTTYGVCVVSNQALSMPLRWRSGNGRKGDTSINQKNYRMEFFCIFAANYNKFRR